MSYAYTVITYGGGKILTELFNGIAAGVGSQSYMTLIGIASLFAFTWVVAESVFKQSFQLNIKWFATFFVLYNILLVPKVTVHIKDVIYQNEVNVIDNVPWGLAELASDISQIFYEITKLSESVYSLPDDFRYTRTGTVLASSLVDSASQFRITDSVFAANMNSFMHQCVFYDLLLNQYSVSDLFHSADVWGFISSHASPARAFKYTDEKTGQSTILTCQQGVSSQYLGGQWQTELKSIASIYGQRMFPYSQDPSQQLLSYLPLSYHYLTNLSLSAQQIMQQNIMRNAISDGVMSDASEIRAPAALLDYGYARAQHATRSGFALVGMKAAHWLPLMKIIFEAILYGSFLFILPLMLMPFGTKILEGYAYAIVWVQSWAPIYAILNLIMTKTAQVLSISHATTTNGHLLNLFTMPGITQVNSDIIVLAGQVSIMVPMIAYYICRYGAMGFVSLSNQIAGSVQSSSGSAIQEATTGNMSLGNTSFGNHSAFNTNANHFDTNGRMMAGAFSYQMTGGSTLTVAPDGSAIMNTAGGISSLGTSVNLSESFRDVYQHQADKSFSAAVSDAHQYSASMSSAVRGLYELSHHQSAMEASGISDSMSHQSSENKALRTMDQLTDKFAHDHNLTKTEASQYLREAYTNAKIGGSASFNTNKSLPGKVVSLATGVSAGVHANVDAGVRGSHTHTSTAQNQNILNEAKQFIHDSNYSQSVDTALRGAHDHSFRMGNEEGQRLVNNIGSSFDKAQQERHDMSAQFQRAESYRDMASFTRDKATSINDSAAQPFLNWMVKQSAPGSKGPMGYASAEYIFKNRPELAQSYAEKFAREESGNLMQQFKHDSGGASGLKVAQDHQRESLSIPGSSNIGKNEHTNHEFISSVATKEGLGSDHFVDRSAHREVMRELKRNNARINQISQHINQTGESLKTDNIEKIEE